MEDLLQCALMKKLKKCKEWHASSSKMGMGDYYGTGVKNPQGKIRESSMEFSSASPKTLKKPPKSLA